MNEGFKVARSSICKSVGIRIGGKNGWCNHVDPFVSALGRQDCRDKQLERIRVLKLTLGIGVLPA